MSDRGNNTEQLAACTELTCPHHGEENRRKLECDHPGIPHGPFSYTMRCAGCGKCKFVGHGPLCGDCYREATTPQPQEER